jgi:hypothetical protein
MAENYNPDEFTPDQDEYWLGLDTGNADPLDLYSSVDFKDDSTEIPAK